MPVKIINGNVLDVLPTLPEKTFHTCITSPPYFGLRDYGMADQLGLEPTPDEYIANMVKVFREVKRVLRDDGTLWLNIGDSYFSTTKGSGGSGKSTLGPNHDLQNIQFQKMNPIHIQAGQSGCKPKDLIGIPWMLAFALRADGWYLRQDIIWHKPNPMPESVRDRCTKAHEYIFMFSKKPNYFFDHEAIKEPAKTTRPQRIRAEEIAQERGLTAEHLTAIRSVGRAEVGGKAYQTMTGAGNNATETQRLADEAKEALGGYFREFTFDTNRNRRSVWTVTTKPYKGAHFATFPPDLIEPCVLAGTSERGHCPECGKRWTRVVERAKPPAVEGSDLDRYGDGKAGVHRKVGQAYQNWLAANPPVTKGWKPQCSCNSSPVPDTVLDPFGGSGTTAGVAVKHGRNAILCELNPEYAALVSARVDAIAGEGWDLI
jgi:DNA modification methylase